MFPFASRVVRDDRLTAAAPQQGAQRITVIGRIVQTALRGYSGHGFGADRGVPAMARADDQPPWAGENRGSLDTLDRGNFRGLKMAIWA